MAKKSNVHPDHYKTAGREPVGQNTVHEDHKREFASAAKEASEQTRHPRKAAKPIRLREKQKKKPAGGIDPVGEVHEKKRPNTRRF